MDSWDLYNSSENGEVTWNLSSLTPNQEHAKRDSLYVVVPVTIIYFLIFISGLVGNLVTCVVISNNRYMHTATNYYLFSLAISDLLLLTTGLPQEVVSIWCNYPYLFSETFCIIRGLTAEASANATVLTITAFTAERYLAICHPFLSHSMSKLSRAVKLIVGIWVVAIVCAAPHAAQMGVVGPPDYASCTIKTVIINHSFELSTIMFFVVPMTIISVLYAFIGMKLHRTKILSRSPGSLYKVEQHDSSRRHQLPTQSSRRVVNMLAAVVAAFFVCWAPFHAQRLVAIHGGKDLEHVYNVVTYVSGILYYLSATINPFLYHIMSHKFRQAFKETVERYGVKVRGRSGSRVSSADSSSDQSPPPLPLRVSQRTKTWSFSDNDSSNGNVRLSQSRTLYHLDTGIVHNNNIAKLQPSQTFQTLEFSQIR